MQSASASSIGVGDLLLRAKYVVHRGDPVDVAAGLALSLPTGRADDFQGAGTTRVEPGLIVSRVFGTWLELLANAGIALDAEDVGRSVVQWAIGGTLMPIEQVAVPIVFLGRDQLGAPAEPIANPFFFQIERSDIFEASVGIRWQFAQHGRGVGERARAAESPGPPGILHPDARGRVDVLSCGHHPIDSSRAGAV